MDNRFAFLCRVCLVKDSTSVMSSLADERTRELLFECTSVWVEPDDPFPKSLCAECCNQCKRWSKFKALANHSDRQLRLQQKVGDGHIKKVEEEKLDEAEILIVKQELESEEGEEDMEIVKVEEMVKVKEEPVEYLQGYSLASEEEEVEKDEDETYEPSIGDESDEEEETTTTTINDTPYQCRHRNCPNAFLKLYLLKQHEKVHTNARPFPCNECGKKFKKNKHLVQHKLLHSGIRPFACDQCDKKYTQITHLNDHKKTHCNSIPFECDVCGTKFKYKQSLNRHLKKQHQ